MKPITTYIKAAGAEPIPADDQVDDVHSCSDSKPSVSIDVPASCNGSCTISAEVTRGTKALKNLYIRMDGQIIAGGSLDIGPDSNTYSVSYIPESSGSHEFTAEVVDEGLYDGTASTTSTLTSVPFNFDSAVSVGANVKLTWDDIGGSYKLNSSGGGNGLSLGCTPVGSKCTANVPKATIGSSGSYTLSISSSSPTRTTNSVTASY
jgi:hypothetical protein